MTSIQAEAEVEAKAEVEVTRYLKPRHTEDDRIEIGIDEAGRGCLWGPLVAAAVIWPRKSEWTAEIRELATQVKDSKKVTAKRRAVLEEKIKAAAVGWGVGRVEAAEIDEIGMTRANRLAFQRALEGVAAEAKGAPSCQRILIDGILGLQEHVLQGAEQIVEPQGDGTYLAIAAASILAKEAHDRMVREICAADSNLDTRYGLLNSKGYGTARHRTAIKEHGMDAMHRRLFLRKLLGLDHSVQEEREPGGGERPHYSFLE